MISAVFFFNIITDWGLLWGSLIPAIGLHQSERGNVRIFLKSFFFLEINDQKHQECLWSDVVKIAMAKSSPSAFIDPFQINVCFLICTLTVWIMGFWMLLGGIEKDNWPQMG